MSKESMKKYEFWLNSKVLEENEKKELLEIKDNLEEIEERFYTDLSFGTGGMRGIRGIGRNRINKYTIRKATQGLANYIIKVAGEEGKNKGVAIAYDCRIGSTEYALNTALVLAGNGIKSYLFQSLRTTPELSFATRETKAQAGVMVTASHNPKEYNGYKVYWSDGGQLVDPEASGIVEEVNKLDIFADIKLMSEEEAIKKGFINYIGKEIDDKYIEAVKKNTLRTNINNKDKFTIVYSPLHGTGRVPVQRVLKEMGFDSVYTVPEQEMPDGNFPTCAYANPEDYTVFDMSIKLADKVGANICLANDPDGDRLGVALKDKTGKWIYPNGNQIGILMMNYVIDSMKKIPTNAAIVSTIVSTTMLDAIGKDKGVKVFRTLTGFKFIGEKIREFETEKLDGTFIFGFEESVGYLVGTHVRDKDAVVSSMIMSEMAAYYDSIGTSPLEELEKLYEKYGYYSEETIQVTKGGKSGLEEISELMNNLRNKKHDLIMGQKISVYRDFELSVERKSDGTESKLDYPISNVIQFVLEDGTYVTARPSGTEPKIKYYICVQESAKELSEKKLESIKTGFIEYVESI
ncbi:phospho-sugar mutase [Fusobacterium sp. PH5-44]|uniref:phospho-sugar mutase n=1 Tax=unclassified Fusobacterium TaxID=2648384 RepID=UPI003D1984E2